MPFKHQKVNNFSFFSPEHNQKFIAEEANRILNDVFSVNFFQFFIVI